MRCYGLFSSGHEAFLRNTYNNTGMKTMKELERRYSTSKKDLMINAEQFLERILVLQKESVASSRAAGFFKFFSLRD